MWQPPTGSFTVERPIEPSFALAYRTDEAFKKAFGEALARHAKPFEAALEVFPSDTNAALWVSWNWLADPIVIAAKETSTQNTELNDKLLDKDALAARLLKFADEKDPSGRFYLCEPKDRLAALKLFAEIQGYLSKLSIDASTNNTNVTNNELKITLIKAKDDQKPTIVIEEEPEIDNDFSELKLVSNK